MMRENFDTVFDRKPLFPGNSCFPLSPGALKNTIQVGGDTTTTTAEVKEGDE